MRRGNLEDIEGRRKDCGEREPARRENLEDIEDIKEPVMNKGY